MRKLDLILLTNSGNEVVTHDNPELLRDHLPCGWRIVGIAVIPDAFLNHLCDKSKRRRKKKLTPL